MGTRKVVINNCYGGFGLSVACVKELIRRGCSGISKIPVGKFFKDYSATPKTGYKKEKDKELTVYRSGICTYVGDDNFIYDNITGIPRDDPILVKVIEDLGAEICSGDYAKLKIVEIPCSVTWIINEYDGLEVVEEQHESWS